MVLMKLDWRECIVFKLINSTYVKESMVTDGGSMKEIEREKDGFSKEDFVLDLLRD